MAIDVKTLNGLAFASCKTRNGVAVASIKSINGVDTTAGGGGGPTPFFKFAVSSLSLSDGDPIVGFTNEGSSGSNNGVQADFSKRGTYQTNEFGSLPGMLLDGAGDFYEVGDFSSLTEATVFIVLKWGGGGQGLWYFDTNADSAGGTYYTFGGGIYDSFGTSARKNNLTPGVDVTTPHLYCVRAKAGEWTARINGAQIHTTGTNTPTFGAAATLGARVDGGTWNGHIAEIRIFDTGLSDTDRDDQEAELMTTYGL